MWAYFIMPTCNLITGGPMGMFKNSTKETKEFEKVILEIEKERDTISWADTTIQSCLWNLENPKADRFTIDWCVRDLRENLNKKEEANAKLQYLKYSKLRHQMFMLHMTTNPDKFLDDLDALKKQEEGFPCILKNNLEIGVIDVSFSIELSSCEKFKCKFDFIA